MEQIEDIDSTPDTAKSRKLTFISPDSRMTPEFVKRNLPSQAITASIILSFIDIDKRSDGYILSLILLSLCLVIGSAYSGYILFDSTSTKFVNITKIISKEVLKVPITITERVLNEYLNRWSSSCILKYGLNGDMHKEINTFITNLDVQKQFEKKMELFKNKISKYKNVNEVSLSSFLTDVLEEDKEYDITIDKEDETEDDSEFETEDDSEFEKKEEFQKIFNDINFHQQIFGTVISYLNDIKERTNTLFTVGGSFEETCPDISKGIIKIAEQEYKLSEHNIIAKILNEKELYDMKFEQAKKEIFGGTITVFISIILFLTFFRKIFIINSVIKCCTCKNGKKTKTIEDKDSGKKIKRKSIKRKSIKRKSIKKKSIKRKSIKRKSIKRKSIKRKRSG